MSKTVLTIALAVSAALFSLVALTGCKTESPVRTPSKTPVPQAQIQESGTPSMAAEVVEHG